MSLAGHSVAEIRWRALHCEGEDKCRLVEAPEGWMLIGHARFRDKSGDHALDYVVRCDADWHTLTADLSGLAPGGELGVHIARGAEGWTLDGMAQPGVEAAMDIDLSFTPATNLMPTRRLMASDGVEVSGQAAWLSFPVMSLRPLDQTYRRNGVSSIAYAAEQTGYRTELEINNAGFVTHYPGLWQAEQAHAS